MKEKSSHKRLTSNLITYGIVVAAFVIVQVLGATVGLSSSFQGQLIPICSYIVMALSLNLVVGISGELSLSLIHILLSSFQEKARLVYYRKGGDTV